MVDTNQSHTAINPTGRQSWFEFALETPPSAFTSKVFLQRLLKHVVFYSGLLFISLYLVTFFYAPAGITVAMAIAPLIAWALSTVVGVRAKSLSALVRLLSPPLYVRRAFLWVATAIILWVTAVFTISLRTLIANFEIPWTELLRDGWIPIFAITITTAAYVDYFHATRDSKHGSIQPFIGSIGILLGSFSALLLTNCDCNEAPVLGLKLQAAILVSACLNAVFLKSLVYRGHHLDE